MRRNGIRTHCTSVGIPGHVLQFPDFRPLFTRTGLPMMPADIVEKSFYTILSQIGAAGSST
jgi:hypothetical protein